MWPACGYSTSITRRATRKKSIKPDPNPKPSSGHRHASPSQMFIFCNGNGRIQFAMGHCRGLPLPPSRDPEGDDEENPEADPAQEILATIGPDNAAKYLVASQVQNNVNALHLFCEFYVCFVLTRPPVFFLFFSWTHRYGMLLLPLFFFDEAEERERRTYHSGR